MDLKPFRIIEPDKSFSLKQINTKDTAGLEKIEGIERMVGNTLDLRPLQERLYAEGRHSILIIFQAMDAAGKDSTINNVMSGVNPQGCQVHSFKHPNSDELKRDYLWRSTRVLPESGMIGIFNRSYYEEVLVTQVHPELILRQHLPHINELSDIDAGFWKHRYKQIRNYERRLTMNGTTIIKFFLHISKKEQAKRFLKRIDRPEKNWKFSVNDMQERIYWQDYQEAYERCIIETATDFSPWYVIPADKKWFARTLVSEVIAQTIKELNPQFPTPSYEHLEVIQNAKEALNKELGQSN